MERDVLLTDDLLRLSFSVLAKHVVSLSYIGNREVV